MIYSWQLVAGLLLVDAVEMDMWCLVLCRQDHVCIIHRAGFHNGFAIFLHPNAEVFQQFSTNSGRCAFPGTSSVPTSWWNPELFTNGRLSPTGSQKRLVSNLKRTISNNIQQIGQLPLSQKIGYLQTHVSIVSSFPIKLTSLEYPQNWTPWSHHQLGPFVQRPQRIERRCSWQFHCEGPCSSGAARGPPVYWRNLNRFWECSACEQIWYMMVCAVCIMHRLYVCDI